MNKCYFGMLNLALQNFIMPGGSRNHMILNDSFSIMQEKSSPELKDSANDPGILFDALIRILNRAAIIEKEPVDIGDGVFLHASEVHFIDIIGRFPGENMSLIAKRLGVTKGAVSQTAFKLEKKGCIKRVKEEGDGKKIIAALTETGMKAFLWHREYHSMMDREIAGFSKNLSPEEFKNLTSILFKFGDLFESCLLLRKEI